MHVAGCTVKAHSNLGVVEVLLLENGKKQLIFPGALHPRRFYSEARRRLHHLANLIGTPLTAIPKYDTGSLSIPPEASTQKAKLEYP